MKLVEAKKVVQRHILWVTGLIESKSRLQNMISCHNMAIYVRTIKIL